MTLSARDWAGNLADRGFLIFPLLAGAKEPPTDRKWSEIMTSDKEVIDSWFDSYPDMNYGVCPGDSGVVIDLDIKEDKNGLDTLAGIESEQDMDEWITGETLTVSTPSGGIHMYLKTGYPVGNAHKFPKTGGIDIRGCKGYVVGPGSKLIEGKCKSKDTPGEYYVKIDQDPRTAPTWVSSHLNQWQERTRDHETQPTIEMDSKGSIDRAMDWLKKRDPAVEGLGGDEHTLITAMGLMDFGLSEQGTLDALTDPYCLEGETNPQSWNDRCSPPWDILGRKGTLEEKVYNAWRYRDKDVGAKGGGSAGDLYGDLGDMYDLKDYEGDKEGRFARLAKHTFSGGSMFSRGKKRENIIPEWLPAHGITAMLAKRGGGKTVFSVDLALSIALGKTWHGYPVKEGFWSIYICGEDDEGAEEQVRAWCKHHGYDEPPANFLFLDIITDLMSPEDTREYAEYLRDMIGPDGRAAVFLDTWQRASSRGGQNKDEDMQLAVHHAEALARSLNGPAIIAFHPPKHDEHMVMGSSVIENSTTAIWTVSDHARGKRLEVTRIKGKGVGNFHFMKFEEVELGMKDEFGKMRTGIVPVKQGGVEIDKESVTEGEFSAREAFAYVLRSLEVRRQELGEDNKSYAVSRASRIISEELTDKEETGDKWAVDLLTRLRDTGTVNLKSWRSMNDRILELFHDPKGHDFGDGFALRLYSDKTSKRIKLEKTE